MSDGQRHIWSIGICTGDSPLTLTPRPGGPALAARDVTDLDAAFVADPFLARTPGGWAMFMEVLERGGRGCIGLATSADAHRWEYRGVVLREPFHLSYPHVFEADGQWWMLPEALGSGGVRLYRADAFPGSWSPAAELIHGPAADPTIFEHDGRWWMFTCARPYRHDTLRLHVAPSLLGPWTEHPRSPVVTGDRRLGRPAGRVIRWGDRLIRFAQDCRDVYGGAVTAVEITELTPTGYAERALDTVLGHGSGVPVEDWTWAGMHHVDAHLTPSGWIAAVDGNGRPEGRD